VLSGCIELDSKIKTESEIKAQATALIKTEAEIKAKATALIKTEAEIKAQAAALILEQNQKFENIKSLIINNSDSDWLRITRYGIFAAVAFLFIIKTFELIKRKGIR
jgi:hypothetical protein